MHKSATEDAVASDPLARLLRRWRLALVLAVIGGLLALPLAWLHETETTAEARLAVGSGDLRAYQVAGFAVAAEQLAADYARYISDSSPAQDLLKEALGADVVKLTHIDASPIPESNVLRVEATALDPQVAVAAAQALAEDLAAQTRGRREPTSEQLLSQFSAIALRAAQQQRLVERAGQDATPDQRARLAKLTMRQTALGVAYQQSLTEREVPENRLTVIQPAAVVGDDRVRTFQIYGLSGVLVGLLVALIVANVQRRDRRVTGARPGS